MYTRVKAQISGPPKKGQSFGIISNQVLWEFQVQVRKNMAANFFDIYWNWFTKQLPLLGIKHGGIC